VVFCRQGSLNILSSPVPKPRGIQSAAGRQSHVSWVPSRFTADAYVDKDFSLLQLSFPCKFAIWDCFNPGKRKGFFRDICWILFFFSPLCCLLGMQDLPFRKCAHLQARWRNTKCKPKYRYTLPKPEIKPLLLNHSRNRMTTNHNLAKIKCKICLIIPDTSSI